jgi:hypothetical protein
MTGEDRARRPRLAAGIGLPLRAVGTMARDPHSRGLVLLVASLLIVGTLFYVIAEGWTVVDALYFSAMSLATVGYGDLVPGSDIAKLFTVVYVLCGVGIVVSFFTTLTARTFELQAARRQAGGSGAARDA